MIAPAKLLPGDTICLVAPAGIPDAADMKACVKYLADAGFKVEKGQHLSSIHGRFAGTDAERLFDLQWALNHPAAKAVLCARGGYGLTRYIDSLNLDIFNTKPKWVIGYSDITALLCMLYKNGIQSLHGPMGKNLGTHISEPSASLMLKSISGNPSGFTLRPNKHNRPGICSGKLMGGNLTMLCNTIGTKTEPDYAECILFIEDLEEEIYHADRMLMQLYRTGRLSAVKGIIAGDFYRMHNAGIGFGKTMEEILKEYADLVKIPLLQHFPAGHAPENLPLIVGQVYNLNISDYACSLLPKDLAHNVIEIAR
ncbi:MAG: LD-carboxypeptidase [Bacteroidota bacterium]